MNIVTPAKYANAMHVMASITSIKDGKQCPLYLEVNILRSIYQYR